MSILIPQSEIVREIYNAYSNHGTIFLLENIGNLNLRQLDDGANPIKDAPTKEYTNCHLMLFIGDGSHVIFEDDKDPISWFLAEKMGFDYVDTSEEIPFLQEDGFEEVISELDIEGHYIIFKELYYNSQRPRIAHANTLYRCLYKYYMANQKWIEEWDKELGDWILNESVLERVDYLLNLSHIKTPDIRSIMEFSNLSTIGLFSEKYLMSNIIERNKEEIRIRMDKTVKDAIPSLMRTFFVDEKI